jgi:hypothetical protein
MEALDFSAENALSTDCLCEGIYYGDINNATLPKKHSCEPAWEEESWYIGELQLFEALTTIHPPKSSGKINVLKFFLEKIFLKNSSFKRFIILF